MDIKDHPCAQGLTEECFRAYPQWARKMFAYRLLLTLCPHEITKRLPQLKGLFPLLVPPDWPASDPWVPGYSIDPAAVFPPGWTPGDPLPDGVTLDPGTVFPPGWTAGDPLPDGVTLDPGTVFPPGWTTGDPLPDGVTLDPGTVFPPGWTTGDPLPDGVTLDPGTVFPPGWTAGDPLPSGVTIDPGTVFPPGWSAGDPLPAGVTISPGAVFPPGWTAGDPLPAGVTIGVGQRPAVLGSGPVAPIYIAPWEPGPIHRPSDPPPEPDLPPWFYEPFDSGIGVFTAYCAGGGTAVNSAGRAKLSVPADSGYASIYYDGFAENFPVNYNLSFKLNIVGGSALIYVEIKTGTHRLYYSFYAPTEVYFMIEGGNEYWDMDSYINEEINWETDVAGDIGDFYRGSELIKANMNLRDDAAAPFIYIYATPWGAPNPDTTVYVDEILVQE